MRYAASLLIALLLLAACKGNDAPHTAVHKANWYRRFSGTVCGQAVVVNLYHYGSNTTLGTYYYTGKEQVIDLYGDEDTTADDNLYLSESTTPTRGDDNGYDLAAHWQLTLTADKLTGKWTSADNKSTGDILLKEDYPAGSYPLDVIVTDSQCVQGIASAHSSCQLSIPATTLPQADKAYMQAALMQRLGCNTASATLENCMKQQQTDYLQHFKTHVADSVAPGATDTFLYRHEATTNVWAIYNENDLLVLQRYSYSFRGGAHGIYGSTYTCIDMQDKRTWTLPDIMTVDTPRLQALLRRTLRDQHHMSDTDDMDQVFLRDTIPVTGNVYFTRAGITFDYHPYEIASYAAGPICIFLPYDKVMEVLTPQFRKRMRL